MSTLEDILAKHPLFSDLDPNYIQLASERASDVHFNAGDLIFREGDQADSLYLIRQGKVALELSAPGRGSLTIETLEDGDIVAYSWLIPPHRYRFDGRAVKATHAIAMDGAWLRAKCKEDHKLGYEVMYRIATILAHSLDATRLRLLDYYGYGA